MSLFYDIFNNIRDSFVIEDKSKQKLKPSDTKELEERILSMAADLSNLTREVSRVLETQEKATQMINELSKNVSEISTLLQKQAESSVNIEEINNLVEKLKTSTDSLSNVIDSSKSS